jgi:hypothetical protein
MVLVKKLHGQHAVQQLAAQTAAQPAVHALSVDSSHTSRGMECRAASCTPGRVELTHREA